MSDLTTLTLAARFEYDPLNRRTAQYNADSTVKRFTYDLSGNINQITRCDSTLIERAFDNMNRLTQVTAGGVLQQTFAYDKLSRMTQAVDRNSGRETHTVNYEYDVFNRVTAETQDGKRVSKAYDANSNPTQVTYPSGRVVNKTFNSLDLIATVQYQSNTIAAFTYNKDRQLKTATLGSNITQDLTYNGKGMESGRTYKIAGTVNYSMATTYDVEDNPVSETIVNNALNNQLIKSYTYDNLNRIKTVNSQLYNFNWSYDRSGNLLTTNQNGSSETRVVNADNEYTQITAGLSQSTPTYDPDGNLTAYTLIQNAQLTNQNLIYDWANRLIEVKSNGATVATYTYDALNRRVSKTLNAQSIVFDYIYDGNKEIEEYSNGSFARTYVYADYIDDPIAMETGGTLYYYLKDRQFSVTAIADSSGTIVERYDYSPYGVMSIFDGAGTPRITSAIGNTYTYTGRKWDAESGLYHYRNRMYSPSLGRFLQRDPSGYEDGINLYVYAKNNPMRYLDAMGLTARQSGSWWRSISNLLIPEAYAEEMQEEQNNQPLDP